MLRFVIALLAVSLVCRPAAAGTRTWTDTRGRQIKAKFVRVHDGNVVLLRAGRVVKVPFSNLSADDRRFVSDQLDSKGKPRSAPSGTVKGLKRIQPGADEKPPVWGDRSTEEASTAGEYRTWTDKANRQAVAKFVRVSDGNIVLYSDGKEVPYPFVNFSQEDQAFVASLLRSRGQGHLIPASANLGSMMDDGIEAPQIMGEFEGAGSPAESSAGPDPMGPMPGMDEPEESMADSEPMGPMAGTDESEESMAESEPMGPMPGMGEPEASAPGPDNYPNTHEHFPGGQPGAWNQPEPHHQEVMGYYCENCKYVLPSDFKAVSRCPGCNVKIAFLENSDGTYTTPSGNRVSTKPGPYTTGLTIVISVMVVLGLLARMLGKL